MGQLAESIQNRPMGQLPSQTEKAAYECKAIYLIEEEERLPVPTKDTQVNSIEEREEENEEEMRDASPETEKHKPEPRNPDQKGEFPTSIVPFPNRLKSFQRDVNYAKFLEIFKKLHINIPFVDALTQMPSYLKFFKDILSKKKKIEEHVTVALTEECSAIILNQLPPKLKDPGSFTIPMHIGRITFDRALCDLGASINLMPLSIFRRLGLGKVQATSLTLKLADGSIKYPYGLIEDVLVKAGRFYFPVDFVILDMDEDEKHPIILGRPFLATARASINVSDGKVTLKVGQEEEIFDVHRVKELHKGDETVISNAVYFQKSLPFPLPIPSVDFIQEEEYKDTG